MNVLMMTLLYPKDQMSEAQANAKDKIQNQINSYQHAYIEGLRQSMKPGESLSIVNALPVGIFPLQYRSPWLKKGWHDSHTIWNLSSLNVPPFKQEMRRWQAQRQIESWAAKSTQNRSLLIYTLYLPYLQAALAAKKTFPDLKAAVIVTDLPNELGLSSGRTGLMKRLEYRRGSRSLALCKAMDGFVLLTQPMAEGLGVERKPYMVMEGLIQGDEPEIQPEQPAILYTGTLEKELGIDRLLEAFSHLPQYQLWICGQGGYQQAVEAAAQKYLNIRYFGFVPRQQALHLQSQAAGLINPRPASGVFTRYSFPSKTLEYMRSGKPVLCYKLEGIPDEYDPYLHYISDDDGGIKAAVEALMALSAQERSRMGQTARAFVLANKNPAVQCRRMYDFLKAL